jgi:hypothetical protein
LGLFATKDIKAGSELFYDYNFSCYGGELQKCLCGSESCQKVIGELDDKNQPGTPQGKKRKAKPTKSATKKTPKYVTLFHGRLIHYLLTRRGSSTTKKATSKKGSLSAPSKLSLKNLEKLRKSDKDSSKESGVDDVMMEIDELPNETESGAPEETKCDDMEVEADDIAQSHDTSKDVSEDTNDTHTDDSKAAESPNVQEVEEDTNDISSNPAEKESASNETTKAEQMTANESPKIKASPLAPMNKPEVSSSKGDEKEPRTTALVSHVQECQKSEEKENMAV